MLRIGELLECVLLEESVSDAEINDALDNHERIVINYHPKGKDEGSGERKIEVYAYGTTSSGNPVIRAFQPEGDTTSKVPSWKYFRTDRISSWQPTGETFDHPASEDYHGLGEFNPSGDKTMATVFKVATFGNDGGNTQQSELTKFAAGGGPKLNGDAQANRTKKNAEKLNKDIKDPVTMGGNPNDPSAFKAPKPSGGPQLKPGVQKQKDNGEEIYKTDTERDMERLMRQLDNPRKIDLSKIPRR